MSECKLNLSGAVRYANRRRYVENKKLKLPEPQMYLTPKQTQEKHRARILAIRNVA